MVMKQVKLLRYPGANVDAINDGGGNNTLLNTTFTIVSAELLGNPKFYEVNY